MPVNFAVNVDRFWRDRPLAERFELAAAEGFGSVELLFPRRVGVQHVTSCLSNATVGMSLFDIDDASGASAHGMLGSPAGTEAFRAQAIRDIDLARQWRVSRLNALGGVADTGVPDREVVQTAVGNLTAVADHASAHDVTLLVEYIHESMVSDYSLRSFDMACEVVRESCSEAVRLQFDQFHVELAGLDPIAEFYRTADLIAYIQVASAPLRTEPTPGSAAERFLAEVHRSGWSGTIGFEYDPPSDWRPHLERLKDIGLLS